MQLKDLTPEQKKALLHDSTGSGVPDVLENEAQIEQFILQNFGNMDYQKMQRIKKILPFLTKMAQTQQNQHKPASFKNMPSGMQMLIIRILIGTAIAGVVIALFLRSNL